MAAIMDDDRQIDAEDSSTDDEIQEKEEEQQQQTLSLPAVAGSGKRKVKKSEKKRNQLVSMRPGLIRLSGLPYGFFENELLGYFSQFGTVTRLKLARSKKTAGSRGYAYIEFEDEDVARIAAETMNGYLMFRSLIKSRVVDREKIDTEKLFRNWKRTFTVRTPAQKRAKYNRAKSIHQVEKSDRRRAKKLAQQQARLAAAGIKYELTDFIPLTTTKSEDKQPIISEKKETIKPVTMTKKKKSKTTNKTSVPQ